MRACLVFALAVIAALSAVATYRWWNIPSPNTPRAVASYDPLSEEWVCVQQKNHKCTSYACTIPILPTTPRSTLVLQLFAAEPISVGAVYGGGKWIVPEECRFKSESGSGACAYITSSMTGTEQIYAQVIGSVPYYASVTEIVRNTPIPEQIYYDTGTVKK